MTDLKITRDEGPYNPLEKRNLGVSVAEALLERPYCLLPPDHAFEGAGIYALYFSGDHAPYRPLVRPNKRFPMGIPIYVGKAVPAGARKGGFGLDAPPGMVLWKRLREHADSINQVGSLRLDDFRCR